MGRLEVPRCDNDPDHLDHSRRRALDVRSPGDDLPEREAVPDRDGLEADDMVITTGGYGLDNGTKVKVGKPDEDDDEDSGA